MNKKTQWSFNEVMKFYWRIWNYRLFKERAEIASLLKFVKVGETAIDIGAYKGAYTYWMSKAVGVTGRVYAFEPQKHAYNRLLGILNDINITNVILEPKGLSSKTGEMRLNIPNQNKGGSPGATFEVKSNEEYQVKYSVQVESLDSYFEKLNIDKISFIKCDAEGHELEIFRGGVNILKKYKPILLFECENRHLQEHKIEDVFVFLRQFGYEGQFICRNQLLPMSDFQIDKHQIINQEPYVNNFLFIHKTLVI